MILVITGTPGTGKDTIAKELKRRKGFVWISLNSLVKKRGLWTEKEGGCLVVDMKRLEREVNKEIKIDLDKRAKNILIEGHLACELKIPANICIVLRTEPGALRKRLKKRGYKKEKIEENIFCEELDYCTQKAENNLSCKIYEVRTDKKIKETMKDVEKILSKNGDYFKAGWVDWSGYLLKRDKI